MRDQQANTSDPTPNNTAVPNTPETSVPVGTYTFTPADRIRKKSEYSAVFSDSRKVVDRYFVCYLSAREQKGNKMGLAVSRKVGKAVTRNRVKRYLREFYRTHLPLMTTPYHLVVVARPAAANITFAECAHSMKHLLQRGGVLHG